MITRKLMIIIINKKHSCIGWNWKQQDLTASLVSQRKCRVIGLADLKLTIIESMTHPHTHHHHRISIIDSQLYCLKWCQLIKSITGNFRQPIPRNVWWKIKCMNVLTASITKQFQK